MRALPLKIAGRVRWRWPVVLSKLPPAVFMTSVSLEWGTFHGLALREDRSLEQRERKLQAAWSGVTVDMPFSSSCLKGSLFEES